MYKESVGRRASSDVPIFLSSYERQPDGGYWFVSDMIYGSPQL